jgi:alpha-beta hydrolase superfamily lysophospholipase
MIAWQPDVLGPGWEQHTLELGVDAEGPLVATLVRRTPDPATGPDAAAARDPRPAVLHVHGFNDYFFQTHLAEQLEAHGYVFYALDLRRCGRSARPWSTPHYCTDLREYAEELTVAARLVREELGHDRLVVHAHSTGGLTASLWAHSVRERHLLDALVLDSPWFDLNAHWFDRVVSTRVLDTLGPLDPHRVLKDGVSAYSRSLHVSNGGEWDYDLTLKPFEGNPARAGWLRAVRRGHARLSRGLDIRVPVLVCSAARSGPNTLDNPDLRCSDTVLDVHQIAVRAPLLGRDVTYEPIEGGIHDLTLSAPDARAAYLQVVTDWLARRTTHWRSPAVDASMEVTTT